MKYINLRSHHLLCTQGYQGKGYSEAFVKNMDEVVGALKDSKTKVKLVRGCDDICVACPHKKNGKCAKKTEKDYLIKKLKKEADLVKALGLSFDKIYEMGDLLQTINSQILTKKQANDIYCEDCQWHSVCLWYLSKK